MKTDTAPPHGITVIPNDPDHMMAAQIDAELAGRLKTALKELKSAEKTSDAAYEAWGKAKDTAKATGEKWNAADDTREEKAKATGHILVEVRERYPTSEDFAKFLKSAGGIQERQARTYIAIALGKADYKKHCDDNKEAVKRSRALHRDEVLAEREAKKAEKKAKVSDTKARTMAAGRGLTLTRALVRQVRDAEKLGMASALEILERYGVKKVAALKPEDLGKVREDCKNLLATYNIEVTEVEEPATITVPVTIHEVEQPATKTVHVAKPIKPVTHANGFDGADSFGKNNADRDARFLAGFMDECRASAFLPRLSDDGLVEAADFIMSGEWKAAEEEAA